MSPNEKKMFGVAAFTTVMCVASSILHDPLNFAVWGLLSMLMLACAAVAHARGL